MTGGVMSGALKPGTLRPGRYKWADSDSGCGPSQGRSRCHPRSNVQSARLPECGDASAEVVRRFRASLRRMYRLIAALALLSSFVAAARAQAPSDKGRTALPLNEITAPWTGDLNGMVERRLIRVLTTYSRTLYFIDRGTPRGTAYDQGKLLEDALNRKFGTGLLRISVQFVPVSRDELIPALLAGKGDVVMADMTVTPERARIIDFVEPWIDGVDEIVVTKPG